MYFILMFKHIQLYLDRYEKKGTFMSNMVVAPLVTFILLCYKQEKYIREAVKSVLEQDYKNIEFILSDDDSPDSTFDLLKLEAANYSHLKSVTLNKNPTNLGLVSHFNKLLSMAKGDIIVVAAGDDISLSHRVSSSVEILKDQTISFVSFNDEIIDSESKTLSIGERVGFNGLKKFTLDDYITSISLPFSGASRAFRKSIYEFFGDLSPDCPTEDTPYILRCLLQGDGAVSSDIAIKYRVHSSNLSGVNNIHNIDAAKISNQYLIDIDKKVNIDGLKVEVVKNIKNWVRNNNKRRVLQNSLTKSKNKFIYFITCILFEPVFSIREKAFIFKSAIKI
ncbi:MAG: glycosyltransferase involved in cell wall biosynthesis [Francisellaceae bacterium]|jgi:glycosyltransferase involved in cell wall biosynthesis